MIPAHNSPPSLFTRARGPQGSVLHHLQHNTVINTHANRIHGLFLFLPPQHILYLFILYWSCLFIC